MLYDVNDKEYIDCMSGYGVALVGHCNPKVVCAIREQCKRLMTCHGSFYNDVRAELLEKIIKISPKGLEKVFLCNSGAESVECALKLAVKYTGKTEVISMVRGFHGKTMGALSATWNPRYRKPFQKFICNNFKFVPFGKLDPVENILSKNTAAVLVEPIQGEGGVHVAPEGYLKGLREICNDQDTLLIFDEVQTGFGRTGYMWASEKWNVKPDILCVAKAMGGGIPIGATIAKPEIMDSLTIGEHSSTFGGNPIACAASIATINLILEEDLPKRAKIVGDRFKKNLQNMVNEFQILREVRGLGLMLGLESRTFIRNVLLKSLEKGLILLYSGKNVIRFLPPLTIEMDLLEKTTEILRSIFNEEITRFQNKCVSY